MGEVVLEGVSKYFGKIKAVDNLTLKVEDGEFLVLLGPSGCGKSTLLRLICGLERPTGGNIYFDGKIVNGLEPKERGVAMVFQDYALYPHMSVFDNMALCLKVDKVPKDEIGRRVRETAAILELEPCLRRKPGQLSGGQQQRVALGRALIRRPSVYLLDEPLSNLDASLRAAMRAELKRLHQMLRTTMVYVTHDQVEAMVLGDRVAVMREGKLLQVDRPRRIYDCPDNKFVAEFVGSPQMNFIDCTLVEKFDAVYLVRGSLCLKVPDSFPRSTSGRSGYLEVVMGIRPEHVLVSLDPQEGFVKSSVRLFQQMGNVGYVDLVLEDEVGEVAITAMVSPDFERASGEHVFIGFDESRIHVFDKNSGRSLRVINEATNGERRVEGGDDNLAETKAKSEDFSVDSHVVQVRR
ncbi:MAG: sn-glycerol-3-phosphate import ATP-binding protein UgpC [Syntrophomonadaceae bacterium]|nr:sn-glycerol-3-phosphate import ATP-binding protein UgpC [Bacillota bacterium]